MMTVQMMEAELERQEESMANMAAEKHEVMKRQASTSTERTSITSNWSAADPARDGSVSNNSAGDEDEMPGGTKIQGELLQLRSSLNQQEKDMEEQAKEVVRLKEKLDQRNEIEKSSRVQVTDENFRDKIKEFQSEVERLKKQLAEVEAAKQAEIIKVERLKQSDAERTKA